MSAAVRDSDHEAKMIASQAFAQTFAAFLECSAEIQEAIREMVLIVKSPESTDDERRMALSTIAEALFPSGLDGHVGVDLEAYEDLARPGTEAGQTAMEAQEEHFAARVESLLAERTMTQTQLAEAVGVGQPAISMMLSRTSRPQRRTVEKIAKALGVAPSALWPDLE